MPAPLAFASFASLHMSRAPRAGPSSTPPPKLKKPGPARAHMPPHPAPPASGSSSSSTAMPPPSSASSSSSYADVPAGRSTSLTGKKRPRESDGDGAAKHRGARRTKSTGDARGAGRERERERARERESVQRGLIGVFVPRALEDALAGRPGNYDDLVAHFLPSPTQPSVALQPTLPLLRALTAHAALVDPERHAALLDAVLALPWATGDDRYVKSYVGWAGVLVSAHPALAKQVVAMAVKGLTWQRKMPSAQPVSRRTYHARHHLLLSHLLSLVPTLPSVLLAILNKSFPRKREPEVAHAAWVRNCCELIDYCPELGARVWGAIVDRMLRIDVEITQRVEDDDDEDETEDETEDEDEDGEGVEVASRLRARSASPDPFDLLVSDDVPQPEDDGPDDSDDELDFDDLSSADGSDGEDEAGGAAGAAGAAARAAEQRAARRAALRDMRAKLDGMLVHFLAHVGEAMGAREHASAPALQAAALSAVPASGTSTPTSERPPSPPAPSRPATPTPASAIPALPAPPAAAPSLYPRRPASRAQSLAHFQTLLDVFTRQILPTASTQHVPFVLFLAASYSAQHTDLLLGVLVSQALFAAAPGASAHASSAHAAHAAASPAQRAAAAVYIGSLVCRARFVTDDQARAVMTYLLAFIDGRLRAGPAAARKDELPLFYAVCQAAMLVFCFRWRAFGGDADPGADGGDGADDDAGVVGDMEIEDDRPAAATAAAAAAAARPPAHAHADAPRPGRWMGDLDALQRALTSDLNPLLGCNPDIVKSFAKVAHQTNFAYCFSIIEANEQRAHAHAHPRPSSSASSLSLSSLATGASSAARAAPPAPARAPSSTPSARAFSRAASTPTLPAIPHAATTPALALPRAARQANVDAGLDAYFPFDPYDLPRSARFVAPLYRTWQEVAVGGDESDDESEDDDDDDGSSSSSDDSDGSDDSDDAMAHRLSAGRGLPKAARIGSYGERRRQMLRDGGLSSSLENMSISPNISGLAGA